MPGITTSENTISKRSDASARQRKASSALEAQVVS